MRVVLFVVLAAAVLISHVSATAWQPRDPKKFGFSIVKIKSGIQIRNSGPAAWDGGRQVYFKECTRMLNPWQTYCSDSSFMYVMKTTQDLYCVSKSGSTATVLDLPYASLVHAGEDVTETKGGVTKNDKGAKALTSKYLKIIDELKTKYATSDKAKYHSLTKGNQGFLKQFPESYHANLAFGVQGYQCWMDDDEIVLWGRSFVSKLYKKIDWLTLVKQEKKVACMGNSSKKSGSCAKL